MLAPATPLVGQSARQQRLLLLALAVHGAFGQALPSPLALTLAWPAAEHPACLPVAVELCVANVSDGRVAFARPSLEYQSIEVSAGAGESEPLRLQPFIYIPKDPPDVVTLGPGEQYAALLSLDLAESGWAPGTHRVRITYDPEPALATWPVTGNVLAAGLQTIEAGFEVQAPVGPAELAAMAIYRRQWRGDLSFLGGPLWHVGSGDFADPARLLERLLTPDTLPLASLASRFDPVQRMSVSTPGQTTNPSAAVRELNRLIRSPEPLLSVDQLTGVRLSPMVRDLMARPAGEVPREVINRVLLEDVLEGALAGSIYRVAYGDPDSVYWPAACVLVARGLQRQKGGTAAALAWLDRARQGPMDPVTFEKWKWTRIDCLTAPEQREERLQWLRQVRTECHYAQWLLAREAAARGE